MWNSQQILAYAKRQIIDIELQKAIDNYGFDSGESILKWLFINRIEIILRGDWWNDDINLLHESVIKKVKEFKIPVFIGFDKGEKSKEIYLINSKPCAIVSVIQHGVMNVIDEIVSLDENKVKEFIEGYDKDYFSLDSISKRRRQDLSMR